MTAETLAAHDTMIRNDVTLVGRLAAPAEERTLPSGTVLVTFRVIVGRPPPAKPACCGQSSKAGTCGCRTRGSTTR